MSYAELAAQVLEQDLCTSCGACAAVCPQDLLRISVDRPVAALRPEVAAGDVSCGSCTLCVDVCPGKDTGTADSELRLFGRTRAEHERWVGVSRRTCQARALNSEVLGAASAGGAVTTLLITALRTGMIDAALVVGRDEDRPWIPAAHLVDTEAAVTASAQASYSIAPTLQLLRDTAYQRIAVVGLACQIQALNKMANLPEPPPMLSKVALTIEIACSSNTRLAGTEHLIEDRLRLPLAEVTDLKYRSGRYPGNFTARDGSGTEHSLPFHELVTTFKKFKTFRCLACPDWWSGLADISVADGDPNIFRTSRNDTEVPKTSLVMTRTGTGDELVARAVERDELEVADSTFEPGESLGLQRKRHRYLGYQRKYPERVPHPAMPGEETVQPLSDEDVIERMSPAGARGD
ncbi:coenzyme F420 hydrogenase subunit beta [Amycolatopsis sulphurea]|uniref:Coenzyme F420 hydrogenase subunit beta n=1 Tax=Amycolatopsis sulphurea TaxID=76022 RepID=A0A2A9G2S2_9PSEU|nr:Coenzyme F420 hydrogenase/dehydrogenase, beta subunit C-terminal domain [Amycolatopsis sulphurea]PFG57236.1 coenzyme F420 hydrogenase subunit beta [Amycolatopsis sulphurea]